MSPIAAVSDAGIAASAAPASSTPSALPVSASSTTCSTYVASTCPAVAPRHLRMATLRIFCRTNTRVTLHTPMPPSTTMMKPTRLR